MKSLFASLLLAASLFIPVSVSAQETGLPFGGYVIASIPCTCIPGSVLVQYAPFPFYPLEGPFVFHAMLLVPTTIRYAYQQFLVLPPPTAWHLGKYIPTPSTPCLGVAPACTPPFADGIMFDVGSSFPGFTLF